MNDDDITVNLTLAYSVVWVSSVSILTVASVVSVFVVAKCIWSTSSVAETFIDVSTLDVTVSLKAGLALTNIVRGQVAALGVANAARRVLGDETLVDVCAVVAIAFVTLVTAAEEVAEGVCAVAEDVAGTVLALVLVGHVAPLSAVAVVAVALRVQAGPVLAVAPCRIQTVIWGRYD
jgi:hypothetical protein